MLFKWNVPKRGSGSCWYVRWKVIESLSSHLWEAFTLIKFLPPRAKKKQGKKDKIHSRVSNGTWSVYGCLAIRTEEMPRAPGIPRYASPQLLNLRATELLRSYHQSIIFRFFFSAHAPWGGLFYQVCTSGLTDTFTYCGHLSNEIPTSEEKTGFMINSGNGILDLENG